MTHEEFTGVTFNDLDPSGIRILRSSEFSVVSSAEIMLNILHRAHIYTGAWLRDVPAFAIANHLFVVCLSSMFVCPTQAVETFGVIFSPLCTLVILWASCKILRRSSQRNPSVGGFKCKRGSKIEQWWTYLRLYLISGTRYGLGYN